jgi:hypothetical protein
VTKRRATVKKRRAVATAVANKHDAPEQNDDDMPVATADEEDEVIVEVPGDPTTIPVPASVAVIETTTKGKRDGEADPTDFIVVRSECPTVAATTTDEGPSTSTMAVAHAPEGNDDEAAVIDTTMDAIVIFNIANNSKSWQFGALKKSLKTDTDFLFSCPECEKPIPGIPEPGVNMFGKCLKRRKCPFDRVVSHNNANGCELAYIVAYHQHDFKRDGGLNEKTFLSYCLTRGVWKKPLTLDQVLSESEVIDVVFQRFHLAENEMKKSQVMVKQKNQKEVKKAALKILPAIREQFLTALRNKGWQQANLPTMTPAQFLNRLNRVMSNNDYFWCNNFVVPSFLL